MRLKIENFTLNFLFIFLLKIGSYFLTLAKNPFLRKIEEILLGLNAKLIIVVEKKSWVIESIGKSITENLKKLNLLKAEISKPFFFNYKIIHFGSIHCLFPNDKLIRIKKSNKMVLTWFHIAPTDKRLKIIPKLNDFIDILHTSNLITKNKLIELGFDKNKIIVIPLGVDLSQFKMYNETHKKNLRIRFGLPQNKIIIGSFQKDGIGWGEGLKPKLIKGPDIFCEVIKRIHKDFDIHILLTGPARGYVKQKLEENNIPFTHIYLEDYLDVVDCYNMLDLYLITSRVEGGPLALLEGMATGVPIVSTKVGMVPEMIKNGFNGLISEINDVDNLYKRSIEIIENKDLRRSLIENGLKTVKNYGWETITRLYYEKIYKKLVK